MENVTVVIAAGGRAARLKSLMPKSLLTFHARSYLEITLDVLSARSFRNIVVATNRPDFFDHYRSIAAKHPRVSVVQDCGVGSTIELARDAAVVNDCERILFLYGHAPRPFGQIASLFNQPLPNAVSSRAVTTKRDPIQWNGGRFLEPPYLLNRDLLASTVAETWEKLLLQHRTLISTVDLDGPGEFNFPTDVPLYEKYVKSWASLHNLVKPEFAMT